MAGLNRTTAIALILLLSAAFAQDIGESTYRAMRPLEGLVETVIKIGWDLTGMLIGMDKPQIAYFSAKLGFNKDVYMENVTAVVAKNGTALKTKCSLRSFAFTNERENAVLQCRDLDTGELLNVTKGENGEAVTRKDVGDYNEDGKSDVIDAFYYIMGNSFGSLHIEDKVKGQVMLFAIVIPLVILTYLLMDFFTSTGILRRGTVAIVSIGIALIAARSGLYIGLLDLITSIFGAGGFFLSMLSLYLMIAIFLWFYGGILKSKAIAEASEEVKNAVVQGFAYDLQRGLMGEELAKRLAEMRMQQRGGGGQG